MSTSVLDDRTFENAVPLDAEETAARNAHFESKGYETELILEDGEEAPPADPQVETPPPTPEPVVAPASAAAPAATDDLTSLDDESRADWQSATNDGERLGKYAKRTKLIHELKGTVSQKDQEIEDLRRKLADKTVQAAGVQPSPFIPPASAPAPGAPPQATPKTDPEPAAVLKPKEFDKPKPQRPTKDQFKDADDPYEAHSEAVADYTDKIVEWNNEKRTFDDEQRASVAQQQRQADEQRTQEHSRRQVMNEKLRTAITAHPDFETVTQAANYGNRGILQFVLNHKLDDGLELAYQLTKPEHAEALKAMVAKTDDATTPEKQISAVEGAIADLAVFRYELKQKARAGSDPAPVVAAAPAAPNPPAPVVQPRVEAAAPLHVRGRNASSERPEDVNPMDSDRRRALRRGAA